MELSDWLDSKGVDAGVTLAAVLLAAILLTAFCTVARYNLLSGGAVFLTGRRLLVVAGVIVYCFATGLMAIILLSSPEVHEATGIDPFVFIWTCGASLVAASVYALRAAHAD